jgi:UDP:flavonoid glycosyltransferase YjiC (YdhE family)
MTSLEEKAEDASANAPPAIIIAEAAAAAAAAQEDEATPRSSSTHQTRRYHNRDSEAQDSSSIQDVPPPPYNGADYGQLDISQNGMDTGARVAEDGRINIKINQRSCKLSNLLVPALRTQFDLRTKAPKEPPSLPGLDVVDGLPPPPLNVVIQIVGSRGDVQPFVALGQVLKNKYGHRVRIATHPTFRDFVTENGLEFFSIGGDPAELMAFMVKNPGLMPGIDSLKNGDIGKRRAGIYEMITGCWRSCIEAGDGTGMEASDNLLDRRASSDSGIGGNPLLKPFVADAIIANPPSFAHVHIAEKLGIPLHLMFTMPWSPTQSFPHPLANITSSNADSAITNFISYALVDMLTWQGLGDVINKFRERSLGLEPISIMWAPGMASRLRIPWTYCWSPALIPKPADWGNYIDISGFFFLNLASNYTPSPDLAEFLAAGPPPVYIGFGSIVVDDPNAMTKMIFEAVRKTGQRALVSKGWGGLGADEIGVPDGVFMLGNCPHDWLFKHVSCVVHHGGAGTTAAGIAAGRPTVVVPFFGDQPFWGAMTARAGAGPFPIPYKGLNSDKLANSIKEALKPASLERAAELAKKVKSEDGTEGGAQSFHKQLKLETLRCSLCPKRAAVWRVKRTNIRLSALAATVLGNEGLLNFSDLKLFRAREYETEDGPWDPISGGAAALIGTIGNLTMGIADFPVEVLKSLKAVSTDVKTAQRPDRSSTTSTTESNTPTSKSPQNSTTDLSLKQDQTRSSLASEQSTITAETEATLKNIETESPTENDTPTASRKPSTILSSIDSGHRRWSRDGSRSSSPASQHHRQSSNHASDALSHLTMEGAVTSARAIGRIASAGMKSPLDFTMGLAKGFHNAPKLYGDDTVRPSDKITGFSSGLKAAAKEFHYGFFDGITGLATQPLAGAQKEGAAGFLKGAAKGVGGLILKPAAGIWGLPGYTFKGIYAEIQKHFGHSVQNYIIAARTAQGYEEWKESVPEQRVQIVNAWKSVQVELRKAGKKYGKERDEEIHEIATLTQSRRPEDLITGLKNTRHLTWDDRKKLHAEREKLKRERKKEREVARKNSQGTVKSRCKYCPFDHDEGLHRSQTFPSPQHPISTPGTVEVIDYEEAIQKSITATSRGNPQEDAIIERALRASVRELQQAQENGEIEDETYQRAVAASVLEAKRARGELTAKDEKSNPMEDAGATDEDDMELTRALTQSLQDQNISQQHPLPYENSRHHRGQEVEHDLSSDSGLGTDDDEDFKRTLEESKRLHTENQNKQSTVSTNEVADSIHDNDHDLKRVITESEIEHKMREEALARQKTEEEIVLEYVKKQSLLEEQHKQNVQEGTTA